jgi:hypothetical protein
MFKRNLSLKGCTVRKKRNDLLPFLGRGQSSKSNVAHMLSPKERMGLVNLDSLSGLKAKCTIGALINQTGDR